jgi:MarR family transcriptional regulator for hemolysin
MNDSNPRNNIGFEMGITLRLWRARIDERLAPLGLTQAKWLPLRYLARAGGSLPQRTLVDQLGLEGPSLVRILDELERLGMVERHTCDFDRRAKTVCLTEQVKPLIADISQRADSLRDQILQGIPDQELAAFQHTLARIAHNLGKMAS